MKAIRLVVLGALALMAACSLTSRPASHQFLGAWEWDDPDEGHLGIRIDGNGRCVLTEDDQTWDGMWQAEGEKMIITTENESVTVWCEGADRLMVKEGRGDPIPFRKVK